MDDSLRNSALRAEPADRVDACFSAIEAEHNPTGRCCCNCRWQRPVAGHPWNKNAAFNGRVSVVIAWACTVPDMDNIVLSEREHSLCECHTDKTSAVNVPRVRGKHESEP